MATTVFPESGDAITAGAWQLLNLSMRGISTVTGYALSDPTGLFVDVATGAAHVYGASILSDSVQQKALTASQTNYVFLESSGAVTVNTTGTAPSSGALLLGIATTDGSGITSLTHTNPTTTQTDYIERRKASDQTKTTDTTLAADSSLVFTAGARTRWRVSLMVGVTCTANSHFKSRISIPSGGATLVPRGLTLGAANERLEVIAYSHTSSGTTATLQTSGGGSLTAYPLTYDGIITIGGTAGTVSLQWAQGASHADATTVLAGSILSATRLPG